MTTVHESTITVQVKFMGGLPALIGQRNLALDLPEGSTIGDLLAALSESYGDDFTSRVFSGPGKLHHTTLIFVAGENIKERGGLAARLGDGEVEVIMLPMICGG